MTDLHATLEAVRKPDSTFRANITQEEMDEYLRRNLLHCASVGMKANAEAAAKRIRETRRPSKWLLRLLDGIVERGERVCPEMAKHRDEISPYD